MLCKNCNNHLGLVSYEGYCSTKCYADRPSAWTRLLSTPPECDFDTEAPLDQKVREAEAYQHELFPELLEKEEQTIVRRLKRLLNL